MASTAAAAAAGGCGSGDAALAANRQAAVAVAAAVGVGAGAGRVQVVLGITGAGLPSGPVACHVVGSGAVGSTHLEATGSGTALPPPLAPLPGCGDPAPAVPPVPGSASTAGPTLGQLAPGPFSRSLARLHQVRRIGPALVDRRVTVEYEGVDPAGAGSPFSPLYLAGSPGQAPVVVDLWLDGGHHLVRWDARLDLGSLAAADVASAATGPVTLRVTISADVTGD